MKYLKILIFSMLIVGLTVGFAMAGPVYVNHGGVNVIYRLSLEAMGTNRAVVIVGTGAGNAVQMTHENSAISYRPNQALVVGNLVKVQFSGGAFAGGAVYACSNSQAGIAGLNGTFLGQVIAVAGSTDENIQLQVGVPVGEAIWFTNAVPETTLGGGGCNAENALKGQLAVRINSTTAGGTPTVTIGAYTTGLAPLDAGGAVNLANVRPEYALNIRGGVHTVDYLGLPGNGTRLLPGTVLYAAMNGPGLNNAGAVNLTQTLNTFNVNTGVLNANLLASLVVNLTDNMAWQGLTKVFLVNGNNPGACTDNAAGNLIGTGTLSGTLALTLPAGAFNGQLGIDVSVCAIAGGNVLTQPRTIQANADINVSGAGAFDPSATPFFDIDVWGTNAYQGYIPWMVNNSLVPTYCLITNNDVARIATVLFEVVGSESASVLSGTLGTLAPKTSILGTFTANSALLAGGTAINLTTLGVDSRYAGKLTLTNNPNVVTVTCVQTDPLTGVKRSVPVLTNSAWGQ